MSIETRAAHARDTVSLVVRCALFWRSRIIALQASMQRYITKNFQSYSTKTNRGSHEVIKPYRARTCSEQEHAQHKWFAALKGLVDSAIPLNEPHVAQTKS